MLIRIYETGSFSDMFVEVATMSGSLAFVTTGGSQSPMAGWKREVGELTLCYDLLLANDTSSSDPLGEFLH
jgi:hypothetical protein